MSFDLQPTLAGSLVLLRPTTDSDFEALYQVASDPLIWQQHPARNRFEEPAFRSFFEQSIASGGAMTCIDKCSEVIIGSSRFHGFDESLSEVEIGWTFLARKYWGGKYNGEMKLLMLSHAFKFVNSVVLLAGPDNIRSQRAIEKLGAKREGCRMDGSGMKSYLYRILARDWGQHR